ncbi:MAG: hypothetical protein IK139_02955 [Lachnospiraceae bacterium]|nr:hypothetical protein [Lachnospiraceae bacterium]
MRCSHEQHGQSYVLRKASDPKASEGIKWELKIAEWELYDFVLWDNLFRNTRKSVTLWFDEWCYSTNFEEVS